MAFVNTVEFFWREYFWIDPLQLCGILRRNKQQPMLFYSGVTEPEANGGQFSFLPFSPQKALLARQGSDFFALLKNNLETHRKLPDNAPRVFQYFCGGLAGFFSYEFAHELEKFSLPGKKIIDCPLGFFQKFETLFAFDQVQNRTYLGGWFSQSADAEKFFQKIERDFLTPQTLTEGDTVPCRLQESIFFIPEISASQYAEQIHKIKNELTRGNSYQVNFSQKWSARTNEDNFEIFQILAQKNPAPMMCFLEYQDFCLISATPERLFSLQNGMMFAQPIKGTRRRGNNTEEDEVLSEELKHDEKELAEHTMIVDLIRNDFGRVAEFGSVHVRDFLRVEKYATVIHLVSDIVGKLAPGYDGFDLIRAMFPGGSVTGAPKIETMRIISETEKSERGAYCGSAGYFSFHGNADFNILIRTIQKQGDQMEVRAGGGIVIDSTAEREYAESLEKAEGILKNLGQIVTER